MAAGRRDPETVALAVAALLAGYRPLMLVPDLVRALAEAALRAGLPPDPRLLLWPDPAQAPAVVALKEVDDSCPQPDIRRPTSDA